MKLLHLTLLGCLTVGTMGCGSKKAAAPAAGELSEAEKADLRKKALENYKKLAEKYPESPYAAQAQERVQALTPPKK